MAIKNGGARAQTEYPDNITDKLSTLTGKYCIIIILHADVRAVMP